MRPIPHRFFAALVVGLLWVVPVSAQTGSTEEPVEPVVNSSLDDALFHDILAAEILAQSTTDATSLRTAFHLLLQAAQGSGDERLYERTTRLALHMRSGTLALQASQAWLRAHPKSLRAQILHLDILITLNRIPESVQALKQAYLEGNAATRLALMESIPQAYTGARDKAQLATLLEQALPPQQMPPELASATWLSLARLQLAAKQPEAAWAATSKAAALAPGSDRPVFLATELIAFQNPQAETMVQRHIALHPDHVELRFAYARGLLLLDQPSRLDDARRQIREVIARKPAWPMPHLILGTIEGEQHNDAASEISLQEYLRLADAAPDDDSPRARNQAYLALSSLALRRNDADRALYWLDRVNNPADPLSLVLRRAEVVAKQGLLEDALALLAVQDDDSESASRRKLLAQSKLLRQARQSARAYDMLDTVRAKGRVDADLIYEQAMLAENLQRFEVMEKLLVELMALKPKEHAAYNALGFFLADHNLRLNEAKALIEKALALVPGDPYVTDSLGWVEFRLGNLPRARTLLEQAFEAKPDAEIAAHLGEVYWAQGDKAGARQMWRRGHQLDPANETLIKTIDRLDPKPRSSAPSEPPAATGPQRWNGRMSLSVQSEPPQQWVAGFELKGRASEGELRVLSPLGSVVTELKWSPGTAQLLSSGKTLDFTNLDELSRQAVGQVLPIAALFDWLQGQATPVEGWTVDLSRHGDGRIVATRHTPAPAAELRVVIDKP